MAFAVAVMVAMPEALVVAEPVNVAEAPETGAVKVTATPTRGCAALHQHGSPVPNAVETRVL